MSNENESNKEEPFALNQKNLKNDILHFKNEMLRDIKNIQKNICEKFDISNNVLKEKIELYDRKMQAFNDKIIQITNLVVTDKDLKEKIEKLSQSKVDLRDHILTNEIKLSNLEKEVRDRVSKIEYILSDSVIYPNVIGQKGKYKTFHEFIDYILFQLNQNIVYREKNSLDVNSYKNKLENISQSLKMQLDNIYKNTNEFTTKSVNECEERIKGILLLYDDRFKEVRVENQNYIKNLEIFYKELKEDFKRLNNMKTNIYNRFNQEVYNIKRDNIQVVKLFGNYKKEFNLMKDKLTKLSEFIKDVRFRINIGQEIKRREFYNMANRIDFSKKHDDVSSGVKKYINGEINAEQLATSNRRLTRSNVNNIVNINPNINNNNILDDDLNNEESMNSINNYLMKNKNFFDFDDNNFNYPPQNKNRLSMQVDNSMGRRKSVNSLMSGSISFTNLKNSPLSHQQQNQNSLYKTINHSNGDLKNPNNKNIVNNDKRYSQSSEIAGRKRYQSVFSKNNNMLINNIEKSFNINSKNILDSEDSKNSNEKLNTKKINNQNINNKNIIIKEEEESNSKISDSESNNNRSISIEERNINNKGNINKIKLNSNSEKNMINKNKNIEKLIPIPIISRQKINDENTNKNKILSHNNNNININTLKNLNLNKPKELQNNPNNRKLSDKKINNNNIVIDCRTNQNQNQNQNKSPIIHNTPFVIEKKSNNNLVVIEKKTMNNNNYNHNSNNNINNKNSNNNIIINNNNNKNNNYINKQQDNNLMSKRKNEEISKIEIIDDKNNQISVHSQTKIKKNRDNNKDDKIKFSQTSNNFATVKEITKNFGDQNKNDKVNNTIGTEYKSFKGKKYSGIDKLFINKIKENIVPYETKNINNKNKNKKNVNKNKEKSNNSNYNNGIVFNQDESHTKHYRNISMDEKNIEAKNIQKMVNNLQSYISSYTNGLEDSINNMYKNKNNFIFKENNYGEKISNNFRSNSTNKNKENIYQIKLK